MGQPLDNILDKKLLDSPEIVSTDYNSEAIDVTNREAELAVQLDYSGGTSVNMTLQLEYSVDGVTYVPVTDSDQVITDASGTHIWDIAGLGPRFLRVSITVTTGSITLDQIYYAAKRRH